MLLLFLLFSIVCLLSSFCSNFDTPLEVQDVHWWKHLMLNYKLQPISLLYVKAELKNHICNRFYGISCNGPVSMERVIKKWWYEHFEQLPGNFSDFFSIMRNFTKYCLHAKFEISSTIQTESAIPHPTPLLVIPICKKPGLFRVNGSWDPLLDLWMVKKSGLYVWHFSLPLSWKLLSIPEILVQKNWKVGITMENCQKRRFSSVLKRLQYISGLHQLWLWEWMCISTLWSYQN